MSWHAVARKDFHDSTRSYLMIGLSLVFILVVSAVASLLGYFTDQPSISGVLNAVHILFSYLVPLLGLVVAHGAIIGERDTGSIKLLLALPHSREDVVLGKVLGRTGALTIPIVIGLLLPVIVLIALGSSINAPQFVGYMILTALVGMSFVAIAVGFSALLSTRIRVIGASLAFYFVFVILWRIINQASFVILLMVAGKWPEWMPLDPNETLQAFKIFSPTGDFFILKTALLNGHLFASDVPQNVAGANVQFSALLMLLVWILLPITLGMYRFNSIDL